MRIGAQRGDSGHQLNTLYVPCDCHQECDKKEEECGHVRMIGWFGLVDLLRIGLGRAMSRRLCLSLIRVWRLSDFHVSTDFMCWAQWLTMSTEAKEAGITVLNEVGLVTQSVDVRVA